jgi:SAM-dependent methyltransferase
VRRTSRRKGDAELAYWKARRAEGPLEAGIPFYEWTFREHFGLGAELLAGARMLDVGCGPRGSLAWAAEAAERVGVDPLADAYRDLQSRDHGMRYVAAGAESIPFPDAYFDVVSCFNALDHVDDVSGSVAELTRVTQPGGTLLLVVDIDHEPTAMEPHRLGWDVLSLFATGWTVVSRYDLERPADNMLANLQAATPFDHTDPRDRPGVLSARLRRNG